MDLDEKWSSEIHSDSESHIDALVRKAITGSPMILASFWNFRPNKAATLWLNRCHLCCWHLEQLTACSLSLTPTRTRNFVDDTPLVIIPYILIAFETGHAAFITTSNRDPDTRGQCRLTKIPNGLCSIKEQPDNQRSICIWKATLRSSLFWRTIVVVVQFKYLTVPVLKKM